MVHNLQNMWTSAKQKSHDSEIAGCSLLIDSLIKWVNTCASFLSSIVESSSGSGVCVALWLALCVAEGRAFSLSNDTELASVRWRSSSWEWVWEFALLKMEKWWEAGTVWRMVTPYCIQPT